MERQPTVVRLVHALPATTIAILLSLAFFVFAAWNAANDPFDGDVADILWPFLILAIVLILLGLAVDGARANGEIVPVEETLAISATDLERDVSRHFAGLGWTAERDDPEDKVFTAPRTSAVGPAAIWLILGFIPGLLYAAGRSTGPQDTVVIAITPVPGGSRLRIAGSRGATEAFQRSLSDLPRTPLAKSDPVRSSLPRTSARDEI